MTPMTPTSGRRGTPFLFVIGRRGSCRGWNNPEAHRNIIRFVMLYPRTDDSIQGMRVIARCVTALLTLAVLLWTAPVTAQPSPPILAFTDIVAGPNTGNRDTSQGQRAGVDGAIVTVWGFNLVGATFTINGAAPAAIYYVGNAAPPACGAADLFNGYHKLQCAILQVSRSATTGAGTIVATAGGL